MNSIIMSIRPEWVEKILNGEKTEEIRKNVGKLVPPFKVYAYVTKGKPYLYEYDGFHLTPTRSWSELHDNGDREWFNIEEVGELNGKVCFEFVCDRVLKLDQEPDYATSYKKIAKGSCLSFNDYYMYATWARNAIVYALHISELKVYDTPKELGEFFRPRVIKMSMTKGGYQNLTMFDKITKAPQSWCKVEDKQDE